MNPIDVAFLLDHAARLPAGAIQASIVSLRACGSVVGDPSSDRLCHSPVGLPTTTSTTRGESGAASAAPMPGGTS
jgi:hypothetical protein